VDPDLEKAAGYFRAAAALNNPIAMFNLALLHLDPESGCADRARALTLLKKAALEGVTEARELLADLTPETSEKRA
jgi:TPR repeat protein